jgi:hypothetical protein
MTFTQTLYKITTQPNGKTFWRLVIKVCNDGDHEITGAVASNPFKKSDITKKILAKQDDKGDDIKGSDTDAARASAKKVTLGAKGQPDACKEVEFGYDVEPGKSYTDFYFYKADKTTLNDQPVKGAANIEDLKPIEVASLTPGQTKYLAICVPLSFPMSLDAVHRGPLSIVTDGLEGLPPGFEVAGAFPPLGKPHKVEYADRSGAMLLILHQRAALPEGSRYSVRLRQQVVHPENLSHWTPRLITFDLVHDMTPPEIRLNRVTTDKGVVKIEVEVSDTCSGIGTLELVAAGPQGESCTVFPRTVRTRSDYSVGYNHAQVTFQIDRQSVENAKNVEVRVADASGNETRLDVTSSLERGHPSSRAKKPAAKSASKRVKSPSGKVRPKQRKGRSR